MQDMKAHLEELRVQVSECELIRDLATDTAKRELFNRLAEHSRGSFRSSGTIADQTKPVL
jgi:hypothetical protein